MATSGWPFFCASYMGLIFDAPGIDLPAREQPPAPGRNMRELQMQISESLIRISCRWRKGNNFRNLSVAIDSDLVTSPSKLLATSLNDNPS